MSADVIVILTGLSGSGKSAGLNAFEDRGYSCVENVPLGLAVDVVKALRSDRRQPARVALCLDLRTADFTIRFPGLIQQLKSLNLTPEVIFFEAGIGTLIRRYSETRRPHPLARETGIREAIETEIELMAPVREIASTIIDTTRLSTADLYLYLQRYIDRFIGQRRLTINLVSFGYKFGIPLESDYLFDMRLLQNPYYLPELRERTGLETEVEEYVISDPRFEPVATAIEGLLAIAIPEFQRGGKPHVTVSIGCTGGRHRSVVMVRRLERRLSEAGNLVFVRHRDMGKRG